MILGDAADRRDFRLEHVRAVEATAQPRLDDGQIHLLLSKPFERNGGQDVEVGWGWLLLGDDRLDEPHQTGKIRLWDHFPVDLDPLTNVSQVRTGIQADLVAVRLQHGGDHGAGAALALGAGHMHGPELIVRVAQLLQQAPHAVQVKVLWGVPHNPEPLVIAQRRKKPKCLCVSGLPLNCAVARRCIVMPRVGRGGGGSNGRRRSAQAARGRVWRRFRRGNSALGTGRGSGRT